MRLAKIEETYAAIKAKPILEKSIEEIQVARREILVKGTINQEKLLKYSAIAILAITLFRYILNLIFVPTLSTVLYFPLILAYITICFAPITIFLHLYNVVRYRLNPKLKDSKEELARLAELEGNEKSSLTVANNMIRYSEIPIEYRTEEILEVLIRMIQLGKARNSEDAVRQYKEYEQRSQQSEPFDRKWYE